MLKGSCLKLAFPNALNAGQAYASTARWYAAAGTTLEGSTKSALCLRVLLFIKFGLERLLPWRPLNCAPWLSMGSCGLRAIKLKIGMPRDHHEIPRLPGARVAAPTGTRAIAVSRRGYQLGLR